MTKSDIKRPYLRMKRCRDDDLQLDLFNRDGTPGSTVTVSSTSLERAGDFLLSTPDDGHAFLTLPGESVNGDD